MIRFKPSPKWIRKAIRKANSRKPITAIHEAGHAVVSESLGGSVETISIEPKVLRDGIEFGIVKHVEEARAVPKIVGITCYVAGQAAEKLAGFRKRYFRGSYDYSYANLIGGVWIGRKTEPTAETILWIRKAEPAAETILRERWPSVEAVAAALLERKILDRKAFLAILGDEFVRLTPSEMEEFFGPAMEIAQRDPFTDPPDDARPDHCCCLGLLPDCSGILEHHAPVTRGCGCVICEHCRDRLEVCDYCEEFLPDRTPGVRCWNG